MRNFRKGPFCWALFCTLVATIHFSSFTCCFCKLFWHSFTGFLRNKTTNFTQSLLCSLFNHSRVHSLFTAYDSLECSSIHIGVRKTDANHENRQTDRRMRANDVAVQGFFAITNHAKVHYSISSVHSEWFTNRSNRIHIFTPATQIVATKICTYTQTSQTL